MTEFVLHHTGKVRALFGEQITIDEGDGVDIKPTETPSNESAKHEADRAKSLGYDRGAIVCRLRSKDQIKNPWTWGIVLFTTSIPSSPGEHKPVGVCWASAPNSRAVSHESVADLILISKAPTDEYLETLKGK